MRATLPLLENSDFPPLRRVRLQTLQVNVGYKCNQSCLHCHVNAGPRRTEALTRETAALCLEYAQASGVSVLDLTGGAPELNQNFKFLVEGARTLGLKVIDRCNLTILEEPGFEQMAEYLASHEVEIVASMPCYIEENVDAQRGKGVYDASISGIRQLNAVGYGVPGSGLELNLVFNPQGPVLPPPQDVLEADYKRELGARYGIRFNRLLTLANLPVGRFGSTLQSKCEFDGYMALLRDAYRPANLNAVMCRSLVSVDWQGYVYDCDFNQMMGLSMRVENRGDRVGRPHLQELLGRDLEGQPIAVRNHCYGCTAGQGSSCGGALT